MEACLESLLEMNFCSKPPNFGVETHMETPAGDALIDCCMSTCTRRHAKLSKT
jgi:hypothetical protein